MKKDISINNSQKKLVTYQDIYDIAKKLPELHRKRNNDWPMVSFINNRSEITAWMGYSFKTKSTKLKQRNIKIRTTFLNLKLQIIRLAQRHWSCMPTR